MNDSTAKKIERFESRKNEITVQPQEDSFLATVERLASNPDIDVSKIQYFFDQREKDISRMAKQAYNASMVNAQAEIPPVYKNKDNQQTSSRYADLSAILKVAKPIYTKHGFAVSFYQGNGTSDNPVPDNHIRMIADIMHADGHTETKQADIPLDGTGIKGSVNKTAPHATGSSFSYGRRYMTCMIFGISTDDDNDGNTKPVEKVSTDMATQIHDLLKETMSDKTKFLKWLKVESVEDIPAAWYSDVVAKLKGKLVRHEN